MNNRQLLEAIAVDLKRIVMGSYTGSSKMTDRFIDEVYKRTAHLDTKTLSSVKIGIISAMEERLRHSQGKRRAARMHCDLQYNYIEYLKNLKLILD